MTDDLVKYLLAAADDSPFESDKRHFTAAAHYIKKLEKDLQLSVYADSQYCKELEDQNERMRIALQNASYTDVDVITPKRNYADMSPLDCYEAGLMDAELAFRKIVKEIALTALGEKND